MSCVTCKEKRIFYTGEEMEERKPHKYAEVVKAWADGKPIQYRVIGRSGWVDVTSQYCPFFDSKALEWRIKPDNTVVEKYIWFSREIDNIVMSVSSNPNVRFTLDPESKKIVKAEVIE